jgi:hypothetical protein
MPKMKPITNPPPVMTLDTENTIISVPHVFLFSGLLRNIVAPNSTRAPHISVRTEIVVNGTIVLLSDLGSVGKIQGKYVPATPTATELQAINNPATKDNLKTGFSIWLIDYSLLSILCQFLTPLSNLIPIS